MVTRSQTLVAYDISNNKVSRKTRELLERLGLRALQKSIYWGLLYPAESRYLLQKVQELLEKTDKFFLIKGTWEGQLKEHSFGYQEEDLIIDTTHYVL